jgi:hypothetical protein
MKHRVGNGPQISQGPSELIEKPKNFGNWLIKTVNAIPFM